MKLGFTLAEVLITLGIIGIVSAMTLPTVINNARDRQFKSMFKKQVSVISQAIQMVYAKDGDSYTKVNWKDMSKFVCEVGMYMKTVGSGLNCSEILQLEETVDPNTSSIFSNPNVEWHQSTKWYDKTGKPMGTNGAFMRYTFYLPDGALINFNSVNQIFIDVNGFKAPNTVGRDIFYIMLRDQSITTSFFETNGKVSVNGYDCPNNCTELTKENYEEDCKNGTGWGCSPLYILE